MSKLYYNNLRYNGAIPTIKTFGGTLDAAMFNGVTIGEETSSTPAPSYTVVDWVYSNDYDYYFDTGVLADKDLKIRLTFKQRYTTGDVIVGFYATEGGGYDNYRIFNYESDLYFDIGWNRIGGYMDGAILTYNNMSLDNSTAYDVTFGNFYYEDNDNADVYGSKSVQVDPSYATIGNHTIKVWPYYFKFHNIQIWNSSNTLLFDGLSVTDADGYVAIYDSVSGTYFRDSSLASGGDDEPVEEPCTECGGSGVVTTTETCPSCGGSGMIHFDETMPCPECEGTGMIDGEPCPRCGGSGEIVEPRDETCPACGGTGEIEQEITCPHCDGTGIEPEDGGGDEPTETVCPECGGTGTIETIEYESCPNCSGTGTIEEIDPETGEPMPVTCPTCNGNGSIEVPTSNTCPTCGGTGYITE